MEYKYDRELYLKPFYAGNVIYFETIFPVENEEIQTLFPIDEIISVTNYGLDKVYIEGKDYKLENGKLVLIEGGDIEITKEVDFYRENPDSAPIQLEYSRSRRKFDGPRYFMFSEGSGIIKHQITITYKHSGVWDGFLPEYQGEKLFKFFSKLKNKESPRLLFYGDSITVGCNSSGTKWGDNIKPNAESWPIMITKHLEDKYSTKIEYFNTAVGGMVTQWGVDNVEERVNQYNPDLLVLAFGMNDGPMSPKEHTDKIRKIIDLSMKHNPNIEIVLVSTTIPNPESNWYFGISNNYVEEYKKINLPNVAVVDMTNTELSILKRKCFKDITGNNVNHPNDFLARVYAQTILKVIDK